MAAHLPSLLPEIGPDGLARDAPVIAYTEKVIEEEQLQLKRYIEENYSKIRDVERELSNLTMEVKLTAGPKKAALEHLRKKIEISTEKIRMAKLKEDQAKKVWEEALKVLKEEEEVKQNLCEDLNRLVQESASTQFSRLEELKRRLEALNPAKALTSPIQNEKEVPLKQDSNPTSNANSIAEVPAQAPENASRHETHGDGSLASGQNQSQMVDGEGRGKKKVVNLNRGRGNLLSKGRESSGLGWTGAGFDVDGRT